MRSKTNNRRAWMAGAAVAAVLSSTAAAQPAQANFTIAAGDLRAALSDYAKQSGVEIFYQSRTVAGRRTAGLTGAYEPRAALEQLVAGTGLVVAMDQSGALMVREAAADPQGGSVAGEVEALIVTAQKREENIQDVPIAMSAFSQEDLTDRQVAGGPDLITQIPNMSFTKTNFSSYSIQIRGIGTQAISATTDPAVAVAFNNTPFIRNRFFEQEFYDLERLEVLRGPQGTLYGRNATAGVVNLISAKPKFTYQAKASADLGNYSSSRLEGMINIPLVEDVVALRLSGAWTKREGYAFNQMTGTQIDGRDLWSTRVSLRFEPTDWISANFIWEHFQEDDDRLRSGKQLCKKHVVTHIGDLPVPSGTGSAQSPAAYVAQGCTAVSLYSDEAFQTPNGDSLPYFAPLRDVGLPIVVGRDPYRNATQSRDLRVIESTVEPDYRANTDIAELQISIDISDNLTLNSETAYGADFVFSLQDYNRFTTTSGIFDPNSPDHEGYVDPNGVYCDPQLGCSDRLLLVDLSTSESTQFSQEFRLGSDFEGPFNFSLGANFLRHDAEDKYYVFINTLSLWAQSEIARELPTCLGRLGARDELAREFDPLATYGLGCVYTDPNPIGALNDSGRNYFLSRNPYKLVSYAAFGEVYYELTPDLKVTAGLRFTVDRKTAPQIPSWLLAGASWTAFRGANGPYPTSQTIVQEWREPSGRLAIDWSPDLGFTDQTLVYASYAHGYKAGGANPPPPVFTTYGLTGAPEPLPDTFNPEFVDAFEIGTKNTLFDGALTLNLTGFYYDYKGYQTSEIRNRSAVNSNFDAEVWGAELEADWRVTEAFRLGFKGGYENTRMADGSSAIDLMDRTAGNPDWMVIRPFPSVPSNCILPKYMLTAGGEQIHAGLFIAGVTTMDGDCIDAYYKHVDPITRLPYVPNPTVWVHGIDPAPQPMPANYADYPGFDPSTAPNGGKGFSKDLSGNELPNAPAYTATVTADYTLPLRGDWLLTLHGDYHYQAESWGRVFNSDPYDRIEAFSTVNASAIFTNEDAGWKVMAYVKNVFDETAITGTFLNSDDSGLTTNVFLTEPRLYGLRVTKDFTGGGWLGSFGERREPGAPYPLQVEIGAGMSRFDGGVETYAPDWVTPVLAGPLSIQDDDLDWGDIRDVKLTYAPMDGWKISAAYRFGRTNGQGRAGASEEVPGGMVQGQYTQHDNDIVSAVHDSEEFAIADFMVGKDTGLGAFGVEGKSTLSAGLRYANFKSASDVAMDGVTDNYVAPVVTKYTGIREFNGYTTSLDSIREFEGTGPALSWDAALRLLGGDQAGHVDLDWSLGGGVLFGKQSVVSDEDRFGMNYLTVGDRIPADLTETTYYDEIVTRRRTEDVTVPNLSLSLGLSYAIDRVKVSTGYSYDRFFDAIDGGVTESQTFDRTIHGPYLKLSLGFGG